MLDADGAGDDVCRHTRFDFDRAARGFDGHPFFILDAITQCGFRVNIGARFRQRFAQARQGAMLAVDEGGVFRVGQDQRKIGGDVGAADRAQRRFDIFRQGWIAGGGELVAVEFDSF